MRGQAISNVVFASVVVVAAILLGGCATEPRMDGPVMAAANSTWTFERRDTGSFGNGTAYQTNRSLGERTWQGRKVWATELPQGIRLSDAEKGDWLVLVKGDAAILSWEPSLGYDWPITVGKSFVRSFRQVNHVTKQTSDVKATMTVEAYEDVTVPAGSFKAFKVRYSDSIGLENVSWFSPDAGTWVKVQIRRSSSFPGGPGTQDLEMLSYTLKK